MSTCSDPRRQRGEVLLEALVGVLIAGLISAGMARMASNVLNGQRDAKVQNLAVEQLRQRLQNEGVGLCGNANLPLTLASGVQVEARVDCVPAVAHVSVAGQAHDVMAPNRVELEISASDLGIKGADADMPGLLLSSGQPVQAALARNGAIRPGTGLDAPTGP